MRNWITTGARLLMALLFTATGLLADDSQPGRSVITKDQVNHYQLSDSEWIIRFDQGLSQAAKDQILDGISYVQRVEHLRSPEISLIKVTPGIPEATLQQLFNAQAGIRYAARGLVYGDGTREFPLDRVFVQLHSASQLQSLQQQAAAMGMQVLEESFMENLYELALDKNSQLEPIAFSNQLNSNSNYDWAEPDMLRLMKKLSTNDTFIGSQWSLENTGTYFGGTPGEDMSVFGAWTTTTGSSSIKVAILDEGVDLNHPDLVGNMLAGFDGHGITSGDAENDDAHGTACAGIVAAVGNNSLGTAGIAYGSKIIPVRIAYSNIDGDWVTSNSIIGNCITWSWQTAGADVLSNSWGGGGSSSLINGPITNAVTLGRGGLGSPVLFAAGNSNTSVIYPASQPDVISVAAMSMCGERKTPTSCDGEYWWGSCFGAGLDVAAPGVKIYTSDIAGADGYSSGDYAPTFNGTSSATPNAAGVMALVLSANPALTEAQARAILETTCDKAGGYTYATDPSYPNGTRCNDLGYGRVNAAAAVLAATGSSSTCDIDGTVGTTTVGSTSATVYFSGTASSATGYMVEYGLSGFTLGTGSTANSVDTTIVLTGLSANTAYDFYIFADCSGTPSDSSEQGSFTTLCGEITSFPFVEDFEAASTTASCWTNEYVVGSSNWTIGTGASGGLITTAYSGTSNARFVSQNGSNSPITKLVSPVMDLSGMVAPQMNFYYAQQNWFGDQNTTKVYYRTSSADPWIQLANYTSDVAAWTNELISLPSPSATYQIAFEGINNWGHSNVIDLVTIEETPSCPTPYALGSFNITDITAEIFWNGGTATGWNIEYGPAGYTFGSGTSATSGNDTTTLTGLNAATTYDIYVQADCGSSWAGPYSFTTLCSSINSFPFVEDFEAASTTASCWTNEYVVGSSNWTIGTGASGGSITTAYSGTNNARFVSQFGSASPVTKLVSPVMDLSGMTAPRMSFYYGQQEWFGDQNELKVYYRVSAGDPWVQISHYTGNIGAWTFELLNLPSPSATYQIAFEGINNYGYRNVIDLVTIEETPSCPTPYALGSFNITDITAEIFWNGGTASGWNIEYGPEGYTFGSGTSATSGNDTTTLTGLTAATTYDVYVQGDCGGAWAGPYSFTTALCSAASQCLYTITMTDSYGDGWNGNVIGFRQGGVVVATVGSSFTSGSGPVSLNFPLCDIQNTEIFVSTLGSYSEEVGFTVTDPFGIDVFTRAPGSSFTSGQVFTTFASSCTPPACAIPTTLTKTFTSTTSVDFNWVAGGSETEWEVAIVSAGSAVPTSGTTVTSAMYSASGLMADSSYTFYVRANCGSATSNWVTMDVNLFHCIPNPSSVDGQGIVNVAFGTINNASGAEPGNYGDYSNLSTDVGQTTNVTVSITFATGYTYDTKIWIDWNDDYDFDDAGEEVYSGTSLSANPTTLAASFVVPANAPLGQHRMRIGSQDVGPPVPCYAGAYGSYEDYSVNVTAPPSCTAPLSITASGVTPTEATLTWLSSSSSSDYVVQYGLSGFSLGSGTIMAVNGDTTLLLSGLTDETSYQAYVQTNCGSDSSTWTGPVSFTTLYLPYPIPYTEDFETTGYPPVNWTEDQGNIANPTVFTGITSGWSNDTWLNGSGNNAMKENLYSTGDDEWAFTPFIDVPAGINVELSFDIAVLAWNSTSPGAMQADDSVMVVISTDGTWNRSNAVYVLHAGNQFGGTDTSVTIDISAYAGNVIQVGFYDETTISGSDLDVMFDNIMVAEAVPTCNTAYNPMAEVISNYTVEFSWNDMGHGTYNLHLRNVGDTAWTTLLASDTSRVLENRAPGDYQFYVSAVGGGDASCVGNFSVNCADDITYTYNVFQAPELGRKGRATILNTLGGKRKYNIALVNSNGDTTLQTNRRIGFFTNLDDDTYTIYVSDAYDCLADSVGMFTINALDTGKIPNLINAPNNSPNGFRPTWNSVDGVINYQLRILNVTDGTLVNFITGITDTMRAVTGLTPGKLYRFNVRSRYNNGVATVNSGYSNPVSRNLAAGGNKDGEGSDLAENAADLINIYPNPVADVLYVNAANGSTVALMDLNGKLISAREINGQEVSFDMSHLASGVYMVRITHANHVTIQKVVKQ